MNSRQRVMLVAIPALVVAGKKTLYEKTGERVPLRNRYKPIRATLEL